jgi:hypothetical protein
MCDSATPTLLSEVDADKKAIADLQAQLSKQSGARAEITKAKINELKTIIKAENKMKASLARARGSFLKTLETAIDATNPLTLLSLSRDQLVDFILKGGMGIAVDDFINQADKITQSVNKTMGKIQPGLGITGTIQNELDIMQTAAVEGVFDDVILPTITAGVRDALTAISVDVPVSSAISALSLKMEKAQGRQLTEINTKLSMYGRSVTAAVAESAGIKYYLYTGPIDSLTRKFCLPLVDKVVSESQMRRLNNRQGLSVKTAGGGYNCRHSWSPVTEGFMKAAQLDKANTKDISDANKGARK